jgi:SAM-dependent methyltransferase
MAAPVKTATTWMLREAVRNAKVGLARRTVRIQEWRRFWDSYQRYSELPGSAASAEFLYPCIGEDTGETPVEPTYFFQDAWAFEKIVAARPERHVDVGSHHRFVSFLSKVVPTTMVDLRPLRAHMESIGFVEGSILALPFPDQSVPSVSSICVVEHIGLGRYGDPLDPHGTEKSLEELKRVVAPGGDLYVSLPIAEADREYFNAHRVFTEETALGMFEPFEVVESRYIYGYEFVEQRRSAAGVGCYHLRRPAA